MKNRNACFVFVFFFFVSLGSLEAKDFYVRIPLLHGVSVQIPKNWIPLNENQNTTLGATVQALSHKAGDTDTSAEAGYAANCYDENGKTMCIFNIRYYPEMELTQSDADGASAVAVEALDKELRIQLEKMYKVSNMKVLEWRGTKKENINGSTAFVTEYTRSQIDNKGIYCARLVRFFRGKDSHTITVSYRVDRESTVRPICDYLISTIKNK